MPMINAITRYAYAEDCIEDIKVVCLIVGIIDANNATESHCSSIVVHSQQSNQHSARCVDNINQNDFHSDIDVTCKFNSFTIDLYK